ncbi:MAG: hypothetical protein GDA44_08360 [Prochloron sp. SP5CPC1]|nr:hypothetical protein [Candidatus Paraprochloron terpiosi SP5CPC1]
MTELTYDSAVAHTVALLNHYGFDMKGYSAEELIAEWLTVYTAIWIRLAAIEALYQGRYKAISVEQILNCWKRRGSPHFHFNGDFERLISRNLPRPTGMATEKSSPVIQQDSSLSPDSVPRTTEVELPRTDQRESVLSEPQQKIESSVGVRTQGVAVQEKQITETIIAVSEIERQALIQSNRPLGQLQSEMEEKSKVEKQPEPPTSLRDSFSRRSQAYKQPIGRFKPQPDGSQCYSKLLAVARQDLQKVE